MNHNQRSSIRYPFAQAVGYQRGDKPTEGSLSGNISLGGLKLSVSGQLQTYVLTLIVSILLLLGALQWVRLGF